MVFRHTQGGEGGVRASVTFVTKKIFFFFKASLIKKRKSFLFKFNHPFWLYTQMVILSHIQRLQRMYRAWTQVLNGFHISPESYLQHFVLSHNHKGLCGRSQSHEIIKNGKKESIPGAVNWALWPQFWPFFKSVKSQRPKIT